MIPHSYQSHELEGILMRPSIRQIKQQREVSKLKKFRTSEQRSLDRFLFLRVYIVSYRRGGRYRYEQSWLAYFHLTQGSFYDGPYPSESLELLDDGLGEIRGRGGSLDVPRLELAILDDLVDGRGDRVGLLVQTEVSQQHARREDHGG